MTRILRKIHVVLARWGRGDPVRIEIITVSILLVPFTLMFLFLIMPPWRFWVFTLLFAPPAPLVGFYFGRIYKAASIEKEKKQKPKTETKEEETKPKKGKVLTQHQVSKKLHNWSRKSELQKSAEASQLKDEGGRYDI
jgi:hypothetical protein